MSWSLAPLLRSTVPPEAIISIFEDVDFFRKAFLIFIILSITYPAAHGLLRCFDKYNRLESAGTKQVNVLHHAVEAIVLTTATPFFTYFMITINFIQHEKDSGTSSMLNDVKSDFTSIFLLCICFMTMYLYELASRFQSPRPAFVVHHLLAVLDGFLAIIFPTTVMVKTCSTLVYFICFEAVTFIGLFMYRIFPLNKFTPRVIMGGIVIFAVTRPIQVIWVGAASFGTWGDPNHVKWQAVMQFLLACLLTILQGWSLTINMGIWKRCKERIKTNKTAQYRQTSPARSKHDNTVDDNTLDCESDDEYPESLALLKASEPGNTTTIDSNKAPAKSSLQAHEEKRKKNLTKSPSLYIFSSMLILFMASIIAAIMVPTGSFGSGSFFDFATKELENINNHICQADDFSDICNDMEELHSIGKKYDILPRHYHLNYQVMLLAYPLYSYIADSDSLLIVSYWIRLHRIHRTLGLGNSLRIQGHSEETVNKAYWDHYSLLSLQDKNMQPAGNGINSLCEYTANEYESMKEYAVENFNESFALSETFASDGPITNTPMYKMCTSDTLLVSYLVRIDWEHHHREVVSSLMNKEHTESIMTHTIWHWESLFAGLFSSPDMMVPLLHKSFDALLPTST